MSYFTEESGLVKYVRVNGGYRFCHNMANHKDLVKRDETVQAAGFISYGYGQFKILNEWSMTCKVGPESEVDGPAIAKLINMSYSGTQY